MIQIFKTLPNNALGCLDIFSRKLKIPVCPSVLQHLSSHRNHALFVYLFLIHRIAHKPKAAWPASSQSRDPAHQSQGWLRMRTTRAHSHVGVCGGACFLHEFYKQVWGNQVRRYFHLETIFYNMSHILKNRFRCLELVQNSCKKCSVQMKKISLQCLFLSVFLTE